MGKRRIQIVPHLILIIVSLVMIVPLYWVLKTSLTGENLFIYPPSLIPENPHVFYFIDVYYWIPFMRYFFNSVLVSVIVVVSNVVLNAMAGFALKYSFPGKRLIILTYLSCTMIPFQTTIIPAFLLTKHLGLLNTHFGLALPLMSTIISIFVFKASFDAVPLGLARFLSYFEDTSGQMYAFVLMVIAPVIAIFLLNQKRFISGVLSGAVKG